jgi:hypothetical protein
MADQYGQFREVTKMQERVFTALDELEQTAEKQNQGLPTLDFGCIESLKLISEGLHDALTDVQNQWRDELTDVLETTNELASTLTGMTRHLENVQKNHSVIVHEAGLQQLQTHGM